MTTTNRFHYDGRPVLPLAERGPLWRRRLCRDLLQGPGPGAPASGLPSSGPPRSSSASPRIVYTPGHPGRSRSSSTPSANCSTRAKIQRHIRRIRREYRVRRDTLVAALRDQLAGRLTFEVPAGGIALWVKAKKGLNVEQWASAASAQGAQVVTAAAYALDGRPHPFMRLGFASLTSAELTEGVRRLAASCPR